jgi:hypothetical protein
MIFAHTLDKVISGDKWQTRRFANPGDTFTDGDKRVIDARNRTVYETGRSYAVQPNRGKKAVARIVLTGLRKESVSAITEEDAIAEGFVSREHFLATWQRIYGQQADLHQMVWVLEFQLIAINIDELKIYVQQRTIRENPSADHRYDVPAAVEGLSGIGLYSGHHQRRRVGASVPYRLPLSPT